MEFPTKVALAQTVPVLPQGPGWWYEPKLDGHRTVLRRTDETVVPYARFGRVVTQHWTDLAVAGMTLRPGTVLDGVMRPAWVSQMLGVSGGWSPAGQHQWRAALASVEPPRRSRC
ncbi:hypothetical protein ACFYY1_42820 [Streptomyces sp. NPDC001890]|uniref:hypothetical protein n=1 Tax=Streptomyces sp. NPDC001890 TaxID=3364620 RepID=UPI0036C53018